MIQENTTNTRINKSISRKRYAERQFGKWVKWSIEQKGKANVFFLKKLLKSK